MNGIDVAGVVAAVAVAALGVFVLLAATDRLTLDGWAVVALTAAATGIALLVVGLAERRQR